MIKWNCPYCDTEYEVENKYADVVKDKERCKFCERKDPDVPTTAEMDGLLTQGDMRNRFKVMKQCKNCLKWTQQDTRKPDVPCHNCGAPDSYDIQSTKSLRTFDPAKDNKRKIKYKK